MHAGIAILTIVIIAGVAYVSWRSSKSTGKGTGGGASSGASKQQDR